MLAFDFLLPFTSRDLGADSVSTLGSFRMQKAADCDVAVIALTPYRLYHTRRPALESTSMLPPGRRSGGAKGNGIEIERTGVCVRAPARTYAHAL